MREYVVLCDREMNVKTKGKVFRTVVRPVLMCGAETLVLKKAQENKLEVAEMEVEVVWASDEKRMSTRLI